MRDQSKLQRLYADITAEGLQSGLSQKLLDQLHRVRRMRLFLDDCSFEVRRMIFENTQNPHTHIVIRRNPPIEQEELAERTDDGRPPIALHNIDMDLRTVSFKEDVDVLTESEMLIVRDALNRLLQVPKGQF